MMSYSTRLSGSFPSIILSIWLFYSHAYAFIVTTCTAPALDSMATQVGQMGRMVHPHLVYFTQQSRFPGNPADATGQNCHEDAHSCRGTGNNLFHLVKCKVAREEGCGYAHRIREGAASTPVSLNNLHHFGRQFPQL